MNVGRSMCGVMAIVGSMALLAGCSGHYKEKMGTKLHVKAVIAGPGITGETDLYEKYEGRSGSS